MNNNYLEQKKNTHLYFQIGKNKYAINTANVLEIMKLPALDYPQKLPNNIIGLLKYNNFVINVVDMEDNYVSEASISIDGKIEKVTDENGQCTIHHLHYGNHAIFIKKDGYSPLIVHIDVDNEEQPYELILLNMSDEDE